MTRSTLSRHGISIGNADQATSSRKGFRGKKSPSPINNLRSDNSMPKFDAKKNEAFNFE